MKFDLQHTDPKSSARAGKLTTDHGDIETPAFVVVGTKGTVKSLKPEDMRDYVGNQVALANTYHLFLQPGDDVVRDAGGLHKFSNWDMPTITDSGGFQVFSLGAAFGKGVTKFAADADGAEKEAEKVIIEAKGKAESNRILSASLTDKILQDKGIEATVKLSESNNSKVIVIGSGDSGMPIILGNQ